MRSLSSAQIGEVFSDLRDRLPQHAREVRRAIKLRTDYDGQLPKRKKGRLKPRAIIQSENAARMEAERAVLKDILRGLHFSKFGTSPKKRAVRRPEPDTSPVKAVPVLLLTDQRSPRRKRLGRTEPFGPFLPDALKRRLAHINAQMAVHFGPWPRRIQNLTDEVIHA
jgi:hypothetical protein